MKHQQRREAANAVDVNSDIEQKPQPYKDTTIIVADTALVKGEKYIAL